MRRLDAGRARLVMDDPADPRPRGFQVAAHQSVEIEFPADRAIPGTSIRTCEASGHTRLIGAAEERSEKPRSGFMKLFREDGD